MKTSDPITRRDPCTYEWCQGHDTLDGEHWGYLPEVKAGDSTASLYVAVYPDGRIQFQFESVSDFTEISKEFTEYHSILDQLEAQAVQVSESVHALMEVVS